MIAERGENVGTQARAEMRDERRERAQEDGAVSWRTTMARVLWVCRFQSATDPKQPRYLPSEVRATYTGRQSDKVCIQYITVHKLFTTCLRHGSFTLFMNRPPALR